jgi:hypothetical protein
VEDLQIAKQRLAEKGLSLVIAKGGRVVFETDDYGVRGLVRAIDTYGAGLNGSSVADTVMGKAAAMLCLQAGVQAVWAGLISEGGMRVLQDAGVYFEFGQSVPEILNRERSATCPFERLTANCNTPEETFKKIKAFLLGMI